jgi:uncharacterized membrane protein YedE/YeeE
MKQPMRIITFFLTGIIFGIVMSKSEAISWFRIHEMFRFESFHMYGIIGVAVALSALILWIAKRMNWKTIDQTDFHYKKPMDLNFTRHILAGSIFGLGWALMGACPGPIYVLIGHGYWIFFVVLAAAILGTFTYGVIGNKLPH